MGGVPVVGGFVQKLGVLAQDQKAMGQPRGHPNLALVFGGQTLANPLAPGGRVWADIDHHIKHLALRDTHQLALGVLHLVVQAA